MGCRGIEIDGGNYERITVRVTAPVNNTEDGWPSSGCLEDSNKLFESTKIEILRYAHLGGNWIPAFSVTGHPPVCGKVTSSRILGLKASLTLVGIFKVC